MQPYILQFGPWLPDGADVAFGVQGQYTATPVPLADCLNVYYAQGAYRSLPSFAATTGGALAAKALGVWTALDSSGNPQIYAGSGSDLYHWTGSAWASVSSSAGAYSGALHWSFATLAGLVLAADGIHSLQDITIGGANFAAIASAPVGNVLGVINQFLFVGDITTPTAFPYRVQWSALGDPTQWPTPLTDAAIAAQSSYEDLDQEFGQVLFIGGGPQLGVILQRNGVTRASYQGGDTVFSFLPIERKRGVIARGAAVQAGAVTHFISDDGFWATDGSQSVPTGTGQNAALDKWFWSNVNQAALDTIQGGWDANLQCVVFAIPTGSNTLPDTLLKLNPQSGQWTKSAIATEMLWSDSDGKRHRLGVFNQSHALGYLTGASASGYCETYDMSFVDQLGRHVSAVTPHIQCTDSPTVRVGTKQALDDVVTYTSDVSRESFTRMCPFSALPYGRFVRGRLTSSAAQAFHGMSVNTEMGAGI
jgi:hypothetical protein